MSEIKQLVEELAKTDKDLARLYTKRMFLNERIAQERIESGDKLIDHKVEAEKLSQYQQECSSDFERTAMADLFGQIYSTGRKRQYKLLAQSGAAGRLPFIAVDDIDKEGVRVVYQGVEGAYSHAAMAEYFGDGVNCFHVDTWKEAMEAIADGEADYAVLPIENSSAGIVGDNFDLLVDFENYIVAEQVINVEHVLMGLPGTHLTDVKKVISHPQALAQCDKFISDHFWEKQPYANTAMAARKVKEDGDLSCAAIGSAFAAKLFHLDILSDRIANNEGNSTRFIIVTNQRVFRKDAKKISICFELPHRAGSLERILSHFTYNDLNMVRIESRSITERNWDYRFFVDFEGNLSSSSVKSALHGIRTEAIGLKILGNY